MKWHEIPEIDNRQRDPVVESYQTLESKGQNRNTSTLNEGNEKEQSEKNEKSPEDDESNQMQVDEDIDIPPNIDCKKLPKYTVEQLESFDYEKIRYTYVLVHEELTKTTPNFSVLEEYKKRVIVYFLG